MLALLERLDRQGRWREALRLARALSGLLALVRRWSAVVRSLVVALQAAEKLDDLSAIAWAKHELGTLQVAAEDAAGAARSLGEAREIRERLGDRRGLAATDRNLQVQCRQLRELLREGRLVQRRGRLRQLSQSRLLLAILAAAILFGAGVAAAVVGGTDDGGTDDGGPAGDVQGADGGGQGVPGEPGGDGQPGDDAAPDECADAVDNDGDDQVDEADPGCADGTEEPPNPTGGQPIPTDGPLGEAPTPAEKPSPVD